MIRADDGVPADAYEVLDDEERRRAAAYRRAADRDVYVAAHTALRRLLAAYLGVPQRELALIRETCPTCGAAHGRPAVADGGVHFSLSHSGSLSLLAFATTPTGVDIEQIPSPRAVPHITRSMHPREQTELTHLPPQRRPGALARTWTRKEAFLKGLGTGLSRAPGLDYVGSGPAPSNDLPGWTVSDVAVDGPYAAAIAVRDPR
ncbi:4'-phosphopantetheinyl transferase family protein [Streptomyces sp. G5(2025)]|uniref:4'-phosphopantetheinyl transferase family protein n=1 Tax=Streptomyces sp. G5(2025) TaxID=3406628 RepID=UPI003C161F6C